MSPRKLQNEIKQDFTADSAVWSSYKNSIASEFAQINYQDLSDHLLREFNRKIVNLGLSEDLMFAPFDSGFRFLGATIGSNLDADAQAYINAVVAAGATVTSAQESAINAFITTGKTEGWYSSLKRLYLPIWASAAPNAIDMIGRTSGTFNGTVTHSAGFVASDGITGYFDIGSSMASHGLSRSSGWLGAIMKTAIANQQYLGAQNGASAVELLRHTTTGITTDYNDSGSGRNSSLVPNRSGIISASRFSGDMKHFQRTTSGRSNIGTFTYADTGSMTSLNAFALAKNSSGVAASGGTSEMGGWWFGTGVSDAADLAFTLALKNLWETCTGLTLP